MLAYLLRLLTYERMYVCMYLFIYLIIYLFIHLFNYLIIYLCVCLLLCLFICLFIYLLCRSSTHTHTYSIYSDNGTELTRSQVVARTADPTASQHATSSVTWPFDTSYVICYWWSFGTESLSPDFFRDIALGVTSLTLQGHVTSSVTQTFDNAYAISYCWSFGTKPLSPTVSEIFNVKCNAMVDVTLILPLNKGQGHSFWYQSISYIRLPVGCQ